MPDREQADQLIALRCAHHPANPIRVLLLVPRHPAPSEAVRPRSHEYILARVAAVLEVVLRVFAQDHNTNSGLREDASTVAYSAHSTHRSLFFTPHKFPQLTCIRLRSQTS